MSVLQASTKSDIHTTFNEILKKLMFMPNDFLFYENISIKKKLSATYNNLVAALPYT